MSEQGNKQQKNNKNRRPFNKNRRFNNKKNSGNKSNRRPKSLTPNKILSKYDNLLEQYVIARRKFFELFGRGSDKQIDKVKRNYDTSLNNLRDYEKKLEDWQKEILDKKTNSLPEDRQYSTTHNLGSEGDSVAFIGEFEDPHLLPTQKETNWSQDSEESEGSMDDYYNYKGITPPPPKPEIEENKSKDSDNRRHGHKRDFKKDNNNRKNYKKKNYNNRNKKS